MSIKKNFAILFILFGVSFSAFSETYQLTNTPFSGATFSTKSELASILTGCWNISGNAHYKLLSVTSVGYPYSTVQTEKYLDSNCNSLYSSDFSASVSTVLVQEEPEPCPLGYVRNEVGLCVIDPDDDFCGSSEFTELLAQQSNSCAASNPDYFTSINSSCTDRENYSFTCVLGIEKPKDPTSPLNPPSGSFNPDNPTPSNPTPPEFDKPEPDDVTPTDTTDTAVLEALRNLNRDNNQAFNSLNTDINNGLASTLNALNQSNSNLNAIGQSIVEQTNQDYMIHQANKLLQQQTTSEITKGASATVGAINSQTETLSNGLGDISDQLGEINDALTGSVESDACSTFNCTGNAASCFVAQTQWRLRCDEIERLSVLSSEGDGLLGDLADFSNAAHDENGAFNKVFTDTTGSVEEALDTYTTSNGFNFNSGCPQPRTYDLGVVGKITIDYTPFCKLALIFRALLMASAAIGSFLMIAKHM